MDSITMVLKGIPSGFYNIMSENIHCLSEKKVYMVKQTTWNREHTYSFVEYFFRIFTGKNSYESLITQSLYESIMKDISFKENEFFYQEVYEYLFGKKTIRVLKKYHKENPIPTIVAIGPKEDEEWQYEFQKYHI